MQFFDVEQGSDSWFELRKGVCTASRFNRIITPKTGRLSAQADDLICELIGEKFGTIPPEGVENFTNRSMRWGQQCEDEARRYYCLHNDCDVTNGGFCLTDDGRFGSSPDFLVGEDGCGELKCPQSGTQVRYLLAGTLPDEYKWQVHGHLIVTGRKWCDWLSYSPGLDPLLIRVFPSEDTVKLWSALEAFSERYATMLRMIREGETV